MITDPQRVRLSDKGHPDVCTVFAYYGVFASADEKEEVRAACTGAAVGCTECKKRLAARLASRLAPLQERRRALAENPGRIRDILAQGAEKARQCASATMRQVRDMISL